MNSHCQEHTRTVRSVLQNDVSKVDPQCRGKTLSAAVSNCNERGLVCVSVRNISLVSIRAIYLFLPLDSAKSDFSAPVCLSSEEFAMTVASDYIT